MHEALTLLTSESVEDIIAQGGSKSWVLNPRRSQKARHVVLIGNRKSRESADGDHRSVFLVGRLAEILPASPTGSDRRYFVRISAFARIDAADPRKPSQNPVRYSSLEGLGIDLNDLQFEEMPTGDAAIGAPVTTSAAPGLTILQAKAGLARTFGVPLTAIEITIRS